MGCMLTYGSYFRADQNIPLTATRVMLADLRLFGMNPFELFDFLSSNLLLPLGGILICFFVGWVYGLPETARQLGNHGELRNSWLVRAVFFLVRFVAPLSIAAVLLHGLKLF
jgi:NSS family neurotransmitter:Na+ symporter